MKPQTSPTEELPTIEDTSASNSTNISKSENRQQNDGRISNDIATASGSSNDNSLVLISAETLSDVLAFIYQMIISEEFCCAAAYACVASTGNPSVLSVYSKLAYALNDPLCSCEYSSEKIFSLMNTIQTSFDCSLIIAASMRTFFSNQIRYDYNLKSLYAGIKDYPLLQECPSLSKAIYSICEFKIQYSKGLDAYADYRLKNNKMIEQRYHQLQKEAYEFYNNYILGKKKENKSFERFLIMKQILFSPSRDIGQYIKAIIDGTDDLQPLAYDFLIQNFFDSDSVSQETINESMLWDYIQLFWEKAQDGLMSKHHADLMGSLRNNVIKTTKKAIEIIARWCDLVDCKSNAMQDDGTLAYKKIKKGLCDNIIDGVNELEQQYLKNSSAEYLAGITIVKRTLTEIRDCVCGEYDENNHKFFYAPFLLTKDVMLNDEFMPDMDMHEADIPELTVQNRIRKFASADNLPTYVVRISQLISEPEDNCGMARLLIDYCSVIIPTEDTSHFLETINNSEEYIKNDIQRRKENFIGELEFAQANGQIDNSTEDTKEKILQIINNWFEWAQESGNYGFFCNVLQAYLDEIGKSAKERESILISQLEEIVKTTVDNVSSEHKSGKIAQIREMIAEQKYTAAEDLLSRFWTTEESGNAILKKDFLKDFLYNYEDYYHHVVSHQSKFSVLAAKRGWNKETKQASDLAENWLPGGTDLGTFRLKALLNLLGFRVRKIEAQNRISIGKTQYENYFIYTDPGREYTHPISAFGTGAVTDGFRIVCMTGIYNADQLISVMKQIGNAKHTLVLLDDALSIVERRRLARKTENELSDKFIGVLDRVVMMYLIRNFDQTHNNRMLLSLVAPFGFYQPYVWKSADIMPPELFIGRKKELETIESRSGANIVYGGRQLGKSRLLKKAKGDIDKDENGDRAVYIDVKYKSYDKVAQAIGHALYDCGILNEDIDTTDWDELSRHIKARLESNQKPIPYLLLLLDEADSFIESCEALKYAPFDLLKDIQGTGKFKFVVAGLHNVVRFKREAALGSNSVLTHLEAITVKPFSLTEARELLEVPLYFLGLRFPQGKDSEYLIPTILSSANYFPGLIQMYCEKLLQAMRDNNYAGYDEVDSPIYEVSTEHIKKILADTEFTNKIREQFEITLGVDEDKYYDVIALIMAFLYHESGYSRGYDVNDIKKVSDEYEITKIKELSIEKLSAFMEELKDLNIFRNTDSTHYLFTRFNFFQMMGSRKEVEEKLFRHMEG